MAKGKSNDLLPTLGGVFSLFVVFLKCLSILGGSAWRISMLLMPALWLVLGLCLLTRQKNWLVTAGMLPLVILMAQGAWRMPTMNSVSLFLNDLLCSILPAVGYVMLFVFMFLSCLHTASKFRRELWFLPILLVLPSCIWQHASTLPWAQFGMIACVSLWLKPAGK